MQGLLFARFFVLRLFEVAVRVWSRVAAGVQEGEEVFLEASELRCRQRCVLYIVT